MASMTTETYAKLYDSVNQRLVQDGQTMPVRRESFLAAAEMPPGVLDISLLEKADNRVLFEVAYICLLSAIPGPETLHHWGKFLDSLSPSQFKSRFLRVALNRFATFKRGVALLNCEEFLDS